jgi:hypothetical protein
MPSLMLENLPSALVWYTDTSVLASVFFQVTASAVKTPRTC